ncbi:MAG: hypothetical protein ABI321_14440 [Polyangia bacterium]
MSCGKAIPEAARDCVFCGVAQPVVAADVAAAEAAAPEAAVAHVEAAVSAPVTSSRAAVTMMGLNVSDIEAAVKAHDLEQPAPALQATPALGLPIVEPELEAAQLEAPPVRRAPVPLDERPVFTAASSPFSSIARIVMGSGGLVLVALFSLPWRGASSWQLLDTLAGADFVRQLYFLLGGAVLVAAAVLPVPAGFRAVVGTLVASIPVVLGAEGLIEGWRGLVAALAIVGLPAALLCARPHLAMHAAARLLLLAAVAALALLYVLPTSSVVPITYVGQMLASGLLEHMIIGVFLGAPLVLAALSLLAGVGRDLASAAALLATLMLAWAPAALLFMVHDGTQLYVALALLWTSATAALCVAQLLMMAATRSRA